MTQPVGHLDGVRVLDLGIWRPAPYATQLLAELGADVIKVEPPGGDPMRQFPDLYRTLNAQKAVTECDLKTAEGRRRVADLAAQADVVVEGFRPGVVDRLGVGEEVVRAVNPSVVYCSISGFGQEGPLTTAPGHDLNYQAWAGVLAARLPEVHRPGVPLADLAGGVHAAFAICAALVGRDRTGEGERIDVSMADVLVSWAGPDPGGALTTGADPARNFPAYGTFGCRDGYVTLGVVSEDGWWQQLCAVLGLADVAQLDTAARAAKGDELRERVEGAIGVRERDELVDQLIKLGIPAAPVLSRDEAVGHEHFRSRGTTVVFQGGLRFGHPVRHGRHPARVTDRAAPAVLPPDGGFDDLASAE